MEQKLAIKLRNKEICPISSKDDIKIGAMVVVKTSRGEEYGQIVSFYKKYPKKQNAEVHLKKVLRYATEQDIKKAEALLDKETKAVETASIKAREFELSIKIIAAEYVFDLGKLYLYYKSTKERETPNLRDYRRHLAGLFNAEVTLRHLAPRDEARFIGGLGHCGRSLCCGSFLTEPRHVTVKMVKEQGMQISPSKTSGMCNRLMCCLSYEFEKKEGGK